MPLSPSPSPGSPSPTLGSTPGVGIGAETMPGGSSSPPPQTPGQNAKPPGMKTLVYSPDCRVYIARGNKQYDVSKDLVGGGVNRVENAASSISFRVINKQKRYNNLFEPMDRVVVMMKRVRWVQVFSGYLDSVPHTQLYEGVVNFAATDTIKRLMYMYWDPGLPDSQQLLQQSQYNETGSADGQGQADTGLGSLLRRLLIDVGGWKESNIHIQEFPQLFLQFLEQNLANRKEAAEKSTHAFRRLLLSDDVTGGAGASAGRAYNVTQGTYGGNALTYQQDIMAAVDERRMGPINQDVSVGQTIKEAGEAGAAAQTGASLDPGAAQQRAAEQEAWENIQSTGSAFETSQRESDALILCLMTVMVEAPGFIMYANNAVPESLTFPHDAVSSDYDSVGLFQQRNNGAWGTVAQRMNAKASCGMFLNALAKFDWRNMQPGQACQRVQGSQFPEKYQTHYEEAKQLAATLRAGQPGQTGTGAAPVPPPPQSTVVPGVSSVAGVGGGLTNPLGTTPPATSTPSNPAAATRVGKPDPDSEGAINWAMTQLGVPYGQGQQRPGIELDCSGLCMFAFRSIGVNIGRTTWDQAGNVRSVPLGTIKRGDMYQPHTGHTSIYLGDGTVIEEWDYHQVCEIRPARISRGGTALHACDNGGPDPTAPFAPPELRGPGLPPGTAVGAGGGTNSGAGPTEGQVAGGTEPIARNLFSWMFESKFGDDVSGYFEGEKAYLNDEPLIQMVQAITKARLCNFASAPNGDFVAYYPDYWGLDGKQAVWNVDDIEMKNVQIDYNDNALATHVYVAGDNQFQTGSPIDIYGWLGSQGVVSVEDKFLFSRIQAIMPGVYKGLDGNEIMKRFGVRPFRQEFSQVADARLEFLIATQIFMQKWAEQYATSVTFTFMPELFPGMRLNLVGHNLQVYVTAVQHTFDFDQGFFTTATIMAPSDPNIKKLINTLNIGILGVGNEGDSEDMAFSGENFFFQ